MKSTIETASDKSDRREAACEFAVSAVIAMVDLVELASQPTQIYLQTVLFVVRRVVKWRLERCYEKQKPHHNEEVADHKV